MRRKQLKNQKRIIIISSLSLLLCLCIGYAAFSTNLSITAKGNIKEYTVDDYIKGIQNGYVDVCCYHDLLPM